MNFILFPLMLLSLGSPLPDELVKANRLTIIDTGLVHDAPFNAMDLVAIIEQPAAKTLHLRMVTCTLAHAHPIAEDEMPGVEGFQHMAVFAANAGGDLLDDDAKAALPCPPHCGGGKKLLVTLAYFLGHYE